MVLDNKYLPVIKYIDYVYIENYIKSSLKQTINANNENDDPIHTYLINELKIFSICSKNTNLQKSLNYKINILYLIQKIYFYPQFTYQSFLKAIHIFEKICCKYAYLIDNYVYLLGSIYILILCLDNEKLHPQKLLMELLDIDKKTSGIMLDCVDIFINFYDVSFSYQERINIIKRIENS